MLLAERFSEEPETPEAGGVSGRASSAFGSMMPRALGCTAFWGGGDARTAGVLNSRRLL